MTRRWHLVTGEYPPETGGVGDYSAELARALAGAGDEVHVWTPSPAAATDRARVNVLPDTFGSSTRRCLEAALRERPGILLLQYVPNALGARGLNIAFCRWLLRQARLGADIRVMFHEPYFYFTLDRPWRNGLALGQRAMAALLLRAASRVYFSTENWRRCLAPYGPIRGGVTLSVPSTIPTASSDVSLDRGAPVISHFGTYGTDVSGALLAVLPSVLAACPSARLRLIGRGSDAFARCLPANIDATRVSSTGECTPSEVASFLRTSHLAIQPYPDGVTTRRTSVMAALRNGVPVVTTDGFLTEPVWRSCGVALVPVGDSTGFGAACARLLADEEARSASGAAGRRSYDALFAIERTVDLLRAEPAAAAVVA